MRSSNGILFSLSLLVSVTGIEVLASGGQNLVSSPMYLDSNLDFGATEIGPIEYAPVGRDLPLLETTDSPAIEKNGLLTPMGPDLNIAPEPGFTVAGDRVDEGDLQRTIPVDEVPDEVQ